MKDPVYERNGNMKLRQYLEYEENVTVYRGVPVGRDMISVAVKTQRKDRMFRWTPFQRNALQSKSYHAHGV